MKLERKLRPGPIIILLAVLLLTALIGSYLVRLRTAESKFVKVSINERVNLSDPDSFRDFLPRHGISLDVAGTGGQTLTFTAPFAFEMYAIPYNPISVSKGTDLRCDFVSWSAGSVGSTSKRICQITADGNTYTVKINPGDLARLYKSALQQNGLTDAFSADTGHRLTTYQARQALRAIDAQIYEKGILHPGDYPFDSVFWKSFVRYVALLTPLAVIILITLCSFLMELRSYRRWLAAYGRDHQGDWDRLSGQLPQFHSLKNSGIGDLPVYRKPTFKELLRNAFKTPK